MLGLRKKPRLDPDRVYIVVGGCVLEVGSILEPDTLDIYTIIEHASEEFSDIAYHSYRDIQRERGLMAGARFDHLAKACAGMLTRIRGHFVVSTATAQQTSDDVP